MQVSCWGRPPLLRRNDFDVGPPKLEDFEVPNTQSVVFIEITKLCTIMTRISELYMERRLIQQTELSSIDSALCDWVKNVPEDLRLYDVNGRRKAYYRPALEIFIQYFVAVVMSQMLRHHERDRPWRTSISSRIAASCATVLYDEIYCREETVFLLSNHGFFCLVISLPLICHRPQSEPKRAERKREIAILHSVLNRMRDRYGDAYMILTKMEKLQSIVERSSQQDEDPDAILSETQGTYVHAKELFPFPPEICGDMDLLDLIAAPDQQFTRDDFAPLPDEQLENTFFGCSFMDLFESDLAIFNFMGDDDPNSHATQSDFSSNFLS